MDTEEEKNLEKAEFKRHMAAETDNRLHAFWETYKGGMKGKLGGFVLGAAIGAVLGVPIAAVLTPVLGITTIGGALGIVAAVSGAGMLYAAHDFDQVGKISGGVAAGLQTTEGRLKKFLGQELSQIKDDIKDLKAQAGIPEKPKAAPEPEEYREKHLLERHKGKPFYWKLATVGLIVGVAVGALLAGSPLAATFLEHIGLEGLHAGKAMYTASIAVMGAFGASFGINRDYFRAVFDKTDSWFKTISKPGKSVEPELAQQQTVESPAPSQPEVAPTPQPELAPEQFMQRGEKPSTQVEVATAVLYNDRGHVRSATFVRDQLHTERAMSSMLKGHDQGVFH